MKTILTIVLVIAIFSYGNAQTKVKVYKTPAVETKATPNEAAYLVGSEDMPEYKLEIKTCSTEGQVVLSNGKKAPALSCFIIDKKEYIGGTLVYSKKRTEIIDIKMEPVGKDGARFVVIGKSFNMSFTLINGMILKVDGEEVVFHTKGKGAWKIKKKA